MERLTGKDLRSLAEFLRQLYKLRCYNDFTTHLIEALPTITEGDFTSYNDVNPLDGASVFKTDVIPFLENPVHYGEVLTRHAVAHPILAHMVNNRDGGAVRMSDLVDTRTFRRSSLYNEFYKPLKIPYIVGFALAIDGQRSVTIARHRNAREFADSTKTMINAIRPHLLQAFQNALAVTNMEVMIAAADMAMEKRHQGLISVSHEGRIRFFSPHALPLLRRYGFTFRRAPDWLPLRLRDWLLYQYKLRRMTDDVVPPVEPLLIAGKGGTLQVRHVQNGEEHLLLLEERKVQTLAEDMISFGLTCRESEILSWVAEGKTNSEIGAILSVSRRTVQKHLERIFVKLAVENRTAAISAARQLSGSRER